MSIVYCLLNCRSVASPGGQGGGRPKKELVSEKNAEICNKADIPEDEFEITSATALLSLDKDVSLKFKGYGQKYFSRGLRYLTPIAFSFFLADGTSALAMTGAMPHTS